MWCGMDTQVLQHGFEIKFLRLFSLSKRVFHLMAIFSFSFKISFNAHFVRSCCILLFFVAFLKKKHQTANMFFVGPLLGRFVWGLSLGRAVSASNDSVSKIKALSNTSKYHRGSGGVSQNYIVAMDTHILPQWL